jgi:hypothetical protein
MNQNSGFLREPRQQFFQVFSAKRDASRRGCKAVARDMDEDRAAAAGDTGPPIVVDFEDKVVDPVLAAQPIAWFIGRPPEGAVIAAVVRILAPGIIRADPPDRQKRGRPPHPVGPPPQPHRPKTPERGAAVALALIGLDAGPAERDRYRERPSEQPSLRSPARPGADVDRGERGLAHAGITRDFNCRLLFCPRVFYFAQCGAAKPRAIAERAAALSCVSADGGLT